jgi:hypothetical protein
LRKNKVDAECEASVILGQGGVCRNGCT